MENNNLENIDIDELIADREAFNRFIYTPLEVALDEINRRVYDIELKSKIKEKLPGGILPIMNDDKKYAILWRHIITSNYETRRFIDIVDALEDFSPILCSYENDKFTTNNELKRSLAKLSFYFGKGRNGYSKFTHLNIIDFNESNGKKISDVKTLWGQSLVDFHYELFQSNYPQLTDTSCFDTSNWFQISGGTAKNYYKNLLAVFLRNAILFENFTLDEKEINFTKNVVIPSYIEIIKEFGIKPLIVALEPTEIEGDHFWMAHPHDSLPTVKNKMELL